MRILLALAAILLGLTALSFAGACAEQKDPAPPNIIFVLIDTLRADHLPSYGFSGTSTPALDRIAREGVLFERVIAPSSFTKTSMASIFTSRDPDRHGVRRNEDVLPSGLVTLAEALSTAGYQTLGINTNPWLYPHFGFHAGFDVYENSFFGDGDSVSARGVELAAAARRPFFLYLHYMDAHAPYRPSARFYDEAPLHAGSDREIPNDHVEYLYRKKNLNTPAASRRVAELYAAEIQAVDAAVGILFDGLAARGLLEDSIVVVTSDHGESFREHGTTEHGWNFYPEVYEVPLLFRAPQRIARGRRLTNQVRSIDIAPTLLRLAGLPVPPTFEGSALLPMEEGTLEDRTAVGAIGLHETIPDLDFVAVVSPDHLYIRERRHGTEEFYDLRKDPGAQQNLGPGHDRAAEMAAAISESSAPRPAQVELSPEIRDQLELLGYIEPEPSPNP